MYFSNLNYPQIVNEMASAAGLPCDIDPALCAALRAQKSTKDIGEDDYNIGNWANCTETCFFTRMFNYIS